MNRVVHFEIHTEDVERAKKFYADVFGWEFQGWPMGDTIYWGIMTAPKDSADPGINGGFVTRKGQAPLDGQAVNAFVCTVEVKNIDETITKIEATGGMLALPKFAIPGMAWQAYYKDTEGNIFGIHQPDTSAI